jgi:hypothetical protein
MDVTAINWVAVVAAAVVAWLFGAAWYMALSKPWMAAAKIDPSKGNRSVAPFVVSFVAELVMAVVVTLLLSTLTFGEPSVMAGVIYGFVFWLGFVFTTLAVNHRYEGFGWNLTLIDGGHWLGVLLIIGAIVGSFGGPTLE